MSLPLFNRAALITMGSWYIRLALESMGAKLCFSLPFFRYWSYIIATNSKRVKVVFWSKKVCRGDNILLRFPENEGGPGNPSTPIHISAFHTTNFQSSSAMRGAEFHGNTHCDGPTRTRSIVAISCRHLNVTC